MSGSTAETPTTPDAVMPGIPDPGDSGEDAPEEAVSGVPGGQTRASDAERDAAVGVLREHYTAGRISHDTFLHRMDAALGARNQADLPPLFADLPDRKRPLGWLSAGWAGAGALVNRVLGAAPGRGRDDGQGYGHPAGPPSPRRGLTSGFPVAPRDRTRRGDGPAQWPPVPRTRPRPAVLPFPRGRQVTFTIGRDQNCDLAIDDLTVSRVHARLQCAAGEWQLADLGSTNGTRVNGWRVRGAVDVRPGDIVRFGDAEYVLGDD